MANMDVRLAPSFAEAILRAYYSVAADDCNCRKDVEWTWAEAERSDFVELVKDNTAVKFHQNYSAGTAVVRGTQPMSENQHYWEIKMTSPVYGTDIMIGVGTPDADLSQVPDRFISLLGMDSKTWGLSYTGLFHHSGESHDYSPGFGQGSIIGVHLDMWKGSLSFYKNGKHLGVASTGLTGKTLYAMASSTAARSGMRIIRSCSFPSSLQYLCCSRLRELVPDDKGVLDALNIPPGLSVFLENNLGWLLDQRLLEDSVKECCKRESANKADQNSSRQVSASVCVQRALARPATGNYSHRHSEFEYNRNGQYVLLSSAPCIFHNCNRFQGNSSEPSADIDCSSSDSKVEPMEQSAEVPDSSSCDLKVEPMKQSMEGHASHSKFQTEITDESMEDDYVESSNKRQRFSYNYAMGLSDPDSD